MVRTTKKLVLTLTDDFLQKLTERSKQLGYATPQQYIYDVMRRQLYLMRRSRRKRVKTSEEEYANKFSVPTKQTIKILRSVQNNNES